MNWLKQRGAAKNLRDFHFLLMVAWTVMIPIALVTGLAGAIWFVTVISLLALAETEGGAWQSSRAEVKVVDVVAETANVTADEVNVG